MQVKDDILSKFTHGIYVFFEVCMISKKIMISKEELTKLKYKLEHNEKDITERIYNISLNESIHDYDEVCDDR